MTNHSRSRGIDRIFDILDYLCKKKEAVLISQIVDEIQAPKSTVYELVKILMARSVLETAEESNKIVLGPKLYMYASIFKRHSPIIDLARPSLEKLAEATGEIVELAATVNQKQGILILIKGTRPYWWGGSQSGISFPLPLTSAGQLLCAHMPKKEIKSLFKPEDYQYGGETKITTAEFYNQCQTAIKRGYGIAQGLLDKYLSAISVPLYSSRSVVKTAVCIVFPTGELETRREEFIDKAMRARDEIQDQLDKQKQYGL